jgi:fermentation-respiration switch protein FrsA (DUF1100 family)
MWTSLGRIGTAVALCYALYALLMFLNQRSLLFPGRRAATGSAVDIEPPAGMQRVWLAQRAGRVEAWYLPPPPGLAAPALLFAHGNAEQLAAWPSVIEPARRLGMAALLVEYPGYGRSDGEPSRESIAQVLRSGYDWLASQPHVDAKRIVGYGRSLGGGAVCTLLGQRELAALVLQSTFTDLSPFVRNVGLPPLLLRDRFDNLQALRGFEGPVLLVHGTHDDIIPPAHADALARVARARLIRYPCGHNDCPPDLGLFVDDVEAFLRDADLLDP